MCVLLLPFLPTLHFHRRRCNLQRPQRALTTQHSRFCPHWLTQCVTIVACCFDYFHCLQLQCSSNARVVFPLFATEVLSTGPWAARRCASAIYNLRCIPQPRVAQSYGHPGAAIIYDPLCVPQTIPLQSQLVSQRWPSPQPPCSFEAARYGD